MKKTIIAVALSAITFGANASDKDESAYVFLGVANGSESTGWQATAGFDIDENFGFESTFHYNSDEYRSRYVNANMSWWMMSLTPVVHLDINENIRLYGKGGFFFGGGTIKTSTYYSTDEYSDTTSGLAYGLGIDFMPVESGLSARIGIDWYNIGDVEVGDSTVDAGTEKVVNFNIGYKF